MIMSDFDGQIPQTILQLTRLPGVGRKTANIVLHHAFSIVSGIAVDTHVFRIAHRLNLVDNNATTAGKVEQALMRVYPQEYWGYINSLFILFGREFCKAKAPLCASCPLAELCEHGVK
jgi:endonuclease-3